MVSSNNPECPECGSDWCEKVGGPTSVMLELDGLDVDRCGRYRCEHCGDRFIFEAALPEYSPTCQCPHCKSYRTKIVKTSRTHNSVRRYHVCLERMCLRGFKSRGPQVVVRSDAKDSAFDCGKQGEFPSPADDVLREA